MGQQLIGRPVSQRSSFPTLGTASNPNAPDQSQYLGFTTPLPMQGAPAQAIMPTPPGILGMGMGLGFRGFRGFPGGMPFTSPPQMMRGFGSQQ